MPETTIFPRRRIPAANDDIGAVAWMALAEAELGCEAPGIITPHAAMAAASVLRAAQFLSLDYDRRNAIDLGAISPMSAINDNVMAAWRRWTTMLVTWIYGDALREDDVVACLDAAMPLELSGRPAHPPAPSLRRPRRHAPTTRRLAQYRGQMYWGIAAPVPDEHDPSAGVRNILYTHMVPDVPPAKRVRGGYIALSSRQLRGHDWQPSSWRFYTAPHDAQAKDVAYTMQPRANQLYLGLELEVEREDGAFEPFQLTRLIEHDGLFTKRDGSLDDGLEIVSYPATIDAWHGSFGEALAARLTLLRRLGYRSYYASSKRCGLHVHLSRGGFNGPLHVARFAEYIYRNIAETTLMARRTVDDMDRYASLLREVTDRDVSVVAREKGMLRSPERYAAVNTSNAHTVEVRVFRGTLQYSSIMRSLQWLAALVEWTRYTTPNLLKPSAFRAWLMQQPKRHTGIVRSFLCEQNRPEEDEHEPLEPSF
jgi:hypothetical protein